MTDYTLDPFLSPGEIAIIIPGVPTWFERDYFHADLAARNWIAATELSVISDGNPGGPPPPGDDVPGPNDPLPPPRKARR